MKKIIYILLISSFAYACNVFDVEPEAAISDGVAISNAGALTAAVNGLYDRLQTGYYNGKSFFLGDVSSDISQSVGTWDFYREMDTYAVSPDNNEVRDLFSFIYQVVNQANNIIAGAPNVADATQAQKDRALGEAHFARALAFFDAALIWGGIPGVYGNQGISLPLEPARQAVELPRASLQETYAQIGADLQQALNLLPDTGGPARLTKAAARALLARYHLYLKNYEQAENFATQVISDTKFQLVADYTTIFSSKNTAESIFEMQFDNTDQSTVRFWYVPGAIGGRGELAAHEEFYNAISDTDDRKKLYAFDNVARFFYPTKYIKAGNIDNVHVLRIAEMYLIRAEAKFFTGKGDAVNDLNAVRTRAKLPPLDAINSIDDILNERKVEFAFEGQRWFDLVRTGKALQVLASVPRKNSPGAPAALTDARRQVFPIPSVEINSNRNTAQNDAYR